MMPTPTPGDLVAKYATENRRLGELIRDARAELFRLAPENTRLRREAQRLDRLLADQCHATRLLHESLESEAGARRDLQRRLDLATLPPPPPAEMPPNPPGPVEDAVTAGVGAATLRVPFAGVLAPEFHQHLPENRG